LEATTPDAPTALEKLQTETLQKLDDLTLKTALQIDDVAQRYDKSMKRYQELYTKKNRIEEAQKVQDTRETVAARPDVVSAAELAANAVEEKTQTADVTEEPEPTIAGNKFKGSDKKRITDKYKDFIKALDKSDVKLFRTLFKPEFLYEQFKPFVPGIKLVKSMGANFRVRKVTFNEDMTEATLVAYVDGIGDGKDEKPMKWQKVEGDWYFAMDDDK
ncbi:MAG: hypothetical protein AAF492_09980, partial [Verrucomicrobiota bacterium]